MTHAIKNLILVTKPGIVLGNLISVAGGFLLASKGRIDFSVLLLTLIGTSLVVAAGCILNNCIDRKLDRKMVRTHRRVMPQGHMSPRAAIYYASILGVAGTVLLRAATNVLCVILVLSGFAIYVGLYSLYLKRRSVYATLIGSLAGGVPPLVGYCAVSGGMDSGAWILFLIFGLWQIPHSYAIAVFRIDDYTAAALPVMPVRQGISVTKKQIIGFIIAFTMASLMLSLGGFTGRLYLGAAAVLGLIWLSLALWKFTGSDDRRWAKRVFVFSILSITVLSVMMAVDVVRPPMASVHLSSAP